MLVAELRDASRTPCQKYHGRIISKKSEWLWRFQPRHYSHTVARVQYSQYLMRTLGLFSSQKDGLTNNAGSQILDAAVSCVSADLVHVALMLRQSRDLHAVLGSGPPIESKPYSVFPHLTPLEIWPRTAVCYRLSTDVAKKQ